jgi:transcription elongation GreA/GreB family factor
MPWDPTVEHRVDKRALVARLREQLTLEIARSTSQAVDAAAGAAHEENRAEGDKDMRATEASYVARGHAERVRTLEDALATLALVQVRDFARGHGIASTALVELESNGRRSRYFLVPAAGGERLLEGDVEVSTLTTTSPLGSALLGLAEGDEAELTTAKGTRTYAIVSVR